MKKNGTEYNRDGSVKVETEKSYDASKYEMDIGDYGMTPVDANYVVEGTWSIEGRSSSYFFNIREAEIAVEDGEITAIITIPSTSYLYVYLGTVGEAEKEEDESEFIPGVKNNDGFTEFTIPVSALNQEFSCAAYSKKRKRWYDRIVLLDASTLPDEALLIDLPDYELINDAVEYYKEQFPGIETETDAVNAPEPEATDAGRSDGEYSIEVNMTGGSGRATISSPTLYIVKDGKAYARLLWSSSYYDYVIMGGHKYLNEATDGGLSAFTVPIMAFDEPIDIIGDTTAMDDRGMEIDYKITFYADTVGSKSDIPQEAAKRVIYLAAVLAIAGGAVNYLLKRRRR